MGISAELLVRDKLITFEEFKAIETISSHIEDVFVSRISSNMENPIRLWYEGLYIYV